ncbi:hypothetical protein [Nocardiopsis alborubida]|uniref:Uncharacterized protein n=1 Tax=Nocardiopsis alborubida TaxID=146802 RepID=A0A7X6MA31_9ACTN|nr:hypothetical protein [Nocardiopsis alborubida]NKY97452.1 hypothetical protein [Nocardiopsis alborubida]
MTSITETTGFATGFAMPSRQLSPTAVQGTLLGGHTDVLAVFGGATTAGAGNGRTNGGTGFLGSRSPLMVSQVERTVLGSGVSVESGPALDRGKHQTKHAAEATQRPYGASGECPRRIPA